MADDDKTVSTKSPRAKDVESFDTTGPASESGPGLNQRAQGEASLTGTDEPLVVKTIHEEKVGDGDTPRNVIVSGFEGEEVDAGNGHPYAGVSEDWVRLQPKD